MRRSGRDSDAAPPGAGSDQVVSTPSGPRRGRPSIERMSDENENSGGVKRWFDDNIVPLFVDAPSTGTYDRDALEDENPGPADRLCPVCYHAMSRHTEEVDAATGKVFLRCPGAGTVIETEREEQRPDTQNSPVLD